MVVLKILWGIVKATLYVVSALFGTMDKAGRAATRQAESWGRATDPPTRDRNSYYYDGPGERR